MGVDQVVRLHPRDLGGGLGVALHFLEQVPTVRAACPRHGRGPSRLLGKHLVFVFARVGSERTRDAMDLEADRDGGSADQPEVGKHRALGGERHYEGDF